MSDVIEFSRIFAAVMIANVLTGAFFYAVYRYSQMERDGRERRDGGGHLSTIIFICVFLIGTFYVGVAGPYWTAIAR